MTDEKSYKKRGEKQIRQRRLNIILFGIATVLCIIIAILGIQLWRMSGGKNQPEDVQANSDNVAAPTKEPDANAVPQGDDGENGENGEDSTQGDEKDKTKDDKNKGKDGTNKDKVVRIRKDLDPDKPMVALTFDDGPYDKVTKRIIKTLKDNNGRATFFVVGNRVSNYHEVMEKAYNQGNQIGNHTYTHYTKTLNALKPKQVKSEVTKANRLIKKYTGKPAKVLRPTYGAANSSVRKVMKKLDMALICWNVDSEDWQSRNKKKILKRLNNLSDGDIVLMHDLYETTADAVEVLVPKLVKKGYQLVTIDELFYYKGKKQKPGQIYYMVR